MGACGHVEPLADTWEGYVRHGGSDAQTGVPGSSSRRFPLRTVAAGLVSGSVSGSGFPINRVVLIEVKTLLSERCVRVWNYRGATGSTGVLNQMLADRLNGMSQ